MLLMRHFVVAIAPVTDVAVKDAKSDSPGNYLFVQCTSMLFGTDEDLPKGKPVIAYLSGLFPGRNDIDTNTLRQNIGGPPQLPSQANKFDGSSYKCVLYNYGGGPLFNVRISAHALFMKASRTRTSSGVMTQGDGVDFERPWVLARLRGLGQFCRVHPLFINGIAGKVFTTGGCCGRDRLRCAVVAAAANRA